MRISPPTPAMVVVVMAVVMVVAAAAAVVVMRSVDGDDSRCDDDDGRPSGMVERHIIRERREQCARIHIRRDRAGRAILVCSRAHTGYIIAPTPAINNCAHTRYIMAQALCVIGARAGMLAPSRHAAPPGERSNPVYNRAYIQYIFARTSVHIWYMIASTSTQQGHHVSAAWQACGGGRGQYMLRV